MKQVTDKEMKKLIENNVLRNTRNGFINKHGESVGFYRTRNKRYIEDKYADIAKKLA